MDATVSQRISRIIEARLSQPEPASFERAIDHDRRIARENVLRELPKLEARFTRTIAELNDNLAEGSIRIALEISGHQPIAEATYNLRIGGAPQEAPTLSLGVDWTGAVRAMMHDGPKRTLLATHSVFEMDKARISDLALRLLEAYYL